MLLSVAQGPTENAFMRANACMHFNAIVVIYVANCPGPR